MRYIFTIKTDDYGGNFGRLLCAYLTGQLGDCGVGENFIPKMEKDLLEEFEDSIDQVSDPRGAFRPVGLGVDPNDVEIYFHTKPSQKMIEHMIKQAYKFPGASAKMGGIFDDHTHVKIKGFVFQKEETIRTDIPITYTSIPLD